MAVIALSGQIRLLHMASTCPTMRPTATVVTPTGTQSGNLSGNLLLEDISGIMKMLSIPHPISHLMIPQVELQNGQNSHLLTGFVQERYFQIVRCHGLPIRVCLIAT